ncbi:MAG: OmpA family protein [Flavobacteriales bacterium]|nr:OmpA family protein [Flavobacteriales bacterium]
MSRSPITGLSRAAKENFVGAGVNNKYSRPIHVHKGERYVLVVNNPKRSGGKHTLILHYPVKKKVLLVVKEVKPEKKESVKTLFQLSIVDALTQKLVKSNVSISGLKKAVITIDTIDVYTTYIVKKNHDVLIEAYSKGYMLTSKTVKISKAELEYSTKILLEKIAPGKKVNLKNIQFYGNRSDFLPTARSSLNSLLSFMKQNSKVVIEVEGHVNGPGKKNSQDYKDLSYSRAYAVKGFLIKNGIDKDRIDFKGYGNSKMLYPEPKSEHQQSANRRVEIKILSNEYNSGNRNIH